MPRTPTAKTARTTAAPKEGSKAAAKPPGPRRTAARSAASVARAQAPRATLEALAALRAAAHPLRLRLLELFAQGARTTKQAATALGEPPTRLYHHVHALERAGLVRLRETRAKRGVEEKYYEVSPDVVAGGRAGRLGAVLGQLDAQGVPLAAVAHAMLDATRADVTAALIGSDGATSGGGARRGRAARDDAEAPLVARVVVPSAARAAELRADLLTLLRHRAPPKPSGSPHAGAPEDRKAAGPVEQELADANAVAVGDVLDGAPAWSLTVVLVPIRRGDPTRRAPQRAR